MNSIRLALIPAPPPQKASCWRTASSCAASSAPPLSPRRRHPRGLGDTARWPHGDAFLTLTGYGRQLVDFADKQVTEISCHGLGARLLAPDTRTVIDIGGQDSKVIQLDAGATSATS